MRTTLFKICILYFSFSLAAFHSKAQTIPTFSGTTGENKNISIPAVSKGKYALICFASSKKAQADFETWLDPVYNRYIAKTGFMDDMFDVDVFFVPVFSGAESSMQAAVKRRFMETAQKDLWPHLIFAENGLKETLAPLNMKDPSLPYFYLIDKEGKIIYKTTGAYSEQKFDDIDDLIE